VIIFGLVQFGFYKKKVTKTGKKNETEPKTVQTDRFRFGYFGGETGLTWFFPGLTRFGFFGFRLIKPKSNQTGQFFQNSNQFN
jgi:hypothetical protein